MTTITASLTAIARQYNARALGGLALGDWHFMVGTHGFDTLDPTIALPVVQTDIALTAAVGGVRRLGRLLLSGAAASAVLLAPGIVQVNGLLAVPNTTARRWLNVGGSADTGLNGTWFIREWVSATSVIIEAPLATAATSAGPLTWEFREACILRPNSRAASYQCVIPAPDATSDGLELGEVGIFCRVIKDPQSTGALGNAILFAIAHHPAIAKDAFTKVIHHVVAQS